MATEDVAEMVDPEAADTAAEMPRDFLAAATVGLAETEEMRGSLPMAPMVATAGT